MWKKIKNSLLNIIFPKFCFGCQKEESYLCQDCESVLDINMFHQTYSTQNLQDLYWAASYQSPLMKNLIKRFKYEPFVKELAENFSGLIVSHLQLIEKVNIFSDFIIIPIPIERKRLKWRGFNQSEEVGRHLAEFLKIPLVTGYLIKTKSTLPQAELSNKERKNNIKGIFKIENSKMIEGKKILLIDDVYTTGATMEEAAAALKTARVKEVTGITIVRG